MIISLSELINLTGRIRDRRPLEECDCKIKQRRMDSVVVSSCNDNAGDYFAGWKGALFACSSRAHLIMLCMLDRFRWDT